ncbi:TPA: NAD-dependent epimerase/dehydratase family protein [Vibrio cholerae]|uniref:NAD-dependent epimerase/dehydratase family protein n=1 Tax=Vibrio cholerae TaxID=666 RepID=UPI001157E38E|nr:NAD-dependent epimerase/dehydratase family protein [Vibrio cholerae]ELW1717339.1 NAD-dependent epimerase/dehydratase family protein [Vibrio cholerae]EMC8146071.1 NAD-dependent epimerase/dehydratase family protein [Vibrio cholerae]TQQ30573.1 NAD-dependent epimerase/dehydratase family protein [Vibrio cholerae]TQQ74597.1 NAD-dependent epimerase/dehydratase family protein [Vibrio cholerae]TXZ60371.1 NAD-dependent epimerase/dehydratase family protein [Vibrio cholerae]
MRILLTGADGFIGKELSKNFNMYRRVVRTKVDLTKKDTFFVDSIDERTCWSGAFDNISSVVHLAGLAHSSSYSESEYRYVNTEGTLRLASQAAESGIRRFVFVSSIGVNGEASALHPFSPNDFAKPHNSYALSKYEAELGLKEISKQTGMEVVIVRPTLVYGPNAPGNFGMLTKLVRKLPVLPFGLANNRRDFISVQNLADLLITCATHPKAAGHTFLASDSETVSIKQFTNAIAKGLGKKIYQLPVPVALMRFAGKSVGKSDMIEQLYGNLEVDSSNIKEVLGWTPPYTMEQSMDLLKHTDK